MRGALQRLARGIPQRPSDILSARLMSLAPVSITSTHYDVATIRRDLAAAHTLSAHHGFDEMIWNHISARINDNGAFLVTPGTLHYDEVRCGDLVVPITLI